VELNNEVLSDYIDGAALDYSGVSAVANTRVYGLANAVKVSGYPMQTNVADAKTAETGFNRAAKLGGTGLGEGHDNFLNGVIVQFDLTFSNKAWVELQRYHFIDFISSQSTMHRIAKFDLSSQYNGFVDPRIIEIMNELKDKYNASQDKADYLRLLYSNPAGFRLTAGMTTNYRQLKTIRKQRANHRLPEWRELCAWIDSLPMFMALCVGETKKETK